jgi:Protein of unknown function (DUF3455)
MSRRYRLSLGRAEHIQQTHIACRGHPRRLAALWRLAAVLALGLMGVSAVATPTPVRAVSLPPPPHQLVLTLFAEGVQIYRSAKSTSTPGVFVWQFFGPEATLFTDDTQTTQVGTHFNVNTAPKGTMTTCPVAGFACPSWQADTDGSAVTVGMPLDVMSSPNPDSIPELLLPAVSHVGDGLFSLFSSITFVQRLDTRGGLSTACAPPTGLGEQCDSPYTATYTFFALDEYPDSDLSTTVVIDGCNSGVPNTVFPSGCTISDLIAACAEGASNHGLFVGCVSRLTNDLKKAATITGQQKGTIQSCAAQADVP